MTLLYERVSDWDTAALLLLCPAVNTAKFWVTFTFLHAAVNLTFLPAARPRVQAINPIEMVMEATSLIQKRFYEDYPPHPKEKEYNYKCSSTMKPTQMSVRF